MASRHVLDCRTSLTSTNSCHRCRRINRFLPSPINNPKTAQISSMSPSTALGEGFAFLMSARCRHGSIQERLCLGAVRTVSQVENKYWAIILHEARLQSRCFIHRMVILLSRRFATWLLIIPQEYAMYGDHLVTLLRELVCPHCGMINTKWATNSTLSRPASPHPAPERPLELYPRTTLQSFRTISFARHVL